MKPDVAFYCLGQSWLDADWIKSFILFFDGTHFNQEKFLGPRSI